MFRTAVTCVIQTPVASMTRAVLTPPIRSVALCLILTILAPTTAELRAAEIGRVHLDEQMRVDDRLVELRSVAVKEATFFRIDIYVVGFYSERRGQLPEGLLSADQLKVFVLQFLVDVDRGKLAEAWLQNLQASCTARCDSVMAQAGRLALRLPDVSAGQRVVYSVSPDRTDVLVNGVMIGSLEGSDASRSVLGAFFGPKAPKKLREDLLRSLHNAAGPERRRE